MIAHGLLDPFPATSLNDLQERAAFMARFDRKYLVPMGNLPDVLAMVPTGTSVLEIDGLRAFRYRSLYFDRPDLPAYHLGLRRRPDRFKVRTRHYVDSGLRHLEVKTLGARGKTIKTRIEHPVDDLAELTNPERCWLAAIPQVEPFLSGLAGCLSTTYSRTTLVLPGWSGRVTIDAGLEWHGPGGATCGIPDAVVIETKGPGTRTSFDLGLWRLGHRPVPLSKFGVGLAVLNPDLPANRWHRLRTRIMRPGGDPLLPVLVEP